MLTAYKSDLIVEGENKQTIKKIMLHSAQHYPSAIFCCLSVPLAPRWEATQTVQLLGKLIWNILLMQQDLNLGGKDWTELRHRPAHFHMGCMSLPSYWEAGTGAGSWNWKLSRSKLRHRGLYQLQSQFTLLLSHTDIKLELRNRNFLAPRMTVDETQYISIKKRVLDTCWCTLN